MTWRALPQDDTPVATSTLIARVAEIDTPIGVMVASATDSHLLLLEFSNRRLLDTQLDRVRRAMDCEFAPGETAILAIVRAQLAEYFRGGRRAFTVPLHAPGTPFQNRVWAELQRIPIGTTT